jgi:hypothetical protein
MPDKITKRWLVAQAQHPSQLKLMTRPPAKTRQDTTPKRRCGSNNARPPQVSTRHAGAAYGATPEEGFVARVQKWLHGGGSGAGCPEDVGVEMSLDAWPRLKLGDGA